MERWWLILALRCCICATPSKIVYLRGSVTVLGPPAAFPGKQRYVPSVIASEAPFGKLFLLERSTHGNPVERIEAVDPLVLLASTFNLSVRTPERLTRHLDLAADLAATGHIYRLRIRPEMDATRLAETLHEYLAIS